MAKGFKTPQNLANKNEKHDAPNETELADFETNLDLSSILQQHAMEVPGQLYMSCCYGRGKTLAEISVPRLPKMFQHEKWSFPVVKSYNLQHARIQNTQGPLHVVGGCGRGKMLEMHSKALSAEMECLENTPAVEKNLTADLHPVKTSSRNGVSKSILSDIVDNVDLNSGAVKPVSVNARSESDIGLYSKPSSSENFLQDCSSLSALTSKTETVSISSTKPRSSDQENYSKTISSMGSTFSSDISQTENRHKNVCDVFRATELDKQNNASKSDLQASTNHITSDNRVEGALPSDEKVNNIISKRKPRSSWKLDGSLVVQVENVPKNCGGELQDLLNNFGRIIESEKKSQKGIISWRFRESPSDEITPVIKSLYLKMKLALSEQFETADIPDYVVECLHGAEDLFEGSSFPLICYCPGQKVDEGSASERG